MTKLKSKSKKGKMKTWVDDMKNVKSDVSQMIKGAESSILLQHQDLMKNK